MTRFWKMSIIVLCTILTVFWQSCNNDEEENPPVLTLTGSNLADGIYIADESAEVNITVNVNAPNGFKMLRISYEGITLDTDEVLPSTEGQTTYEYQYQINEIVFGSSGTFNITFEAIDNSDQSGSQKITVQPDLPTITLTEFNPDVTDGTLYATVGNNFSLQYRFTFPAGFAQFKSTLRYGANTSESTITSLPPTQGNAVTDQIIHSFDEDFLGLDISYLLEVTDILGNSASLEVPVDLIKPPTLIYHALVLEAPTEDKNSKTFFSTNVGETYSVAEVSGSSANIAKEVDFGYYYDDTDKASLSGPGNYPSTIYNLGPNGEDWPTLNVMNFKRTDLTESDFDQLDEGSQSEINDAYDNATSEVQLIIKDLQPGEIIAFKTDLKNNKNPRGLIKVVQINGTTGTDASIEIDVIVNQ